MNTIRWQPGDGWAVVAESFVAWLPGAADATLASALFGLDGPEAFAAAGDLLAHSATAYALLQTSDPVVLQNRGPVTVAAWDRAGAPLAADLSTAVGVRLGADTEAGFPIVSGVVGCGSITWGVRVPAVAGPAAPAVASEPAPEPPVAPEPAPKSTVAPAPMPAGFIAEVPAWMASSEPNPFAELWGHTMRRPVEAAAVRVVRDSDAEPEPPAPAPAPVPEPTPPAPDPDPESASRSPAVAPRPQPAPSLTATLVGNLLDLEDEAQTDTDHGEVVAPDGQRIPIVTTVVVGRAPRPLQGQESQLLRVASPERGISRSHVLVAFIDGLVRAKDLGSNNGTVLVRGAARVPLRTDTWTALSSNDALDLGEGVCVRLAGLP
jgi:hypothetical protein